MFHFAHSSSTPAGHVYKDSDGHFIWNDKLSVLHNEVSEAFRKEMYNLVVWVCKHSPASAIKFNEAATLPLHILSE